MSQLNYLDIGDNYDYNYYTFPAFNLPNLQVLKLDDTALTGTLPDLSTLTSLQYLDLSRNEVLLPTTGTLGLASLNQLLYVDFHTTSLSGPVPNLPSSLLYANFYDAYISGTVPSLLGLANLMFLDIGENYYYLTGTLPSISALTGLVYLSLNDDISLSGVVPSFTGLDKMMYLDFYHTSFSGALPDFSIFPNITYVDFGDIYSISGTISTLNLPHLMTLKLEYNSISGTLPSLVALTYLQYLDLNENSISGTLSSLTHLTNLSYIDLDYTFIGGIVDWLSPTVTSCDFYDTCITNCSLCGGDDCSPRSECSSGCTVPCDYGTCSGTTCTCYSGWYGDACNMTDCPNDCSGHGTCDHSDGYCTCDSGWYGTECDIKLCPGDGYCNMNGLCNNGTCYCMSGYTGADCSQPRTITNLEVLFLCDAWFDLGIYDVWPYPCEWTSPCQQSLIYIGCNNSHIYHIGPEYYKRDISISKKQTYPFIPPTINGLTYIETIEVEGMYIGGLLPDISALTHLTLLNLYSNYVSGSIPALATLTMLQHLELENNYFMGLIPSLSGLVNLNYIDLHGNILYGQVPAFTGLNFSYVSMYNNYITGNITWLPAGMTHCDFAPTCIGNCPDVISTYPICDCSYSSSCDTPCDPACQHGVCVGGVCACDLNYQGTACNHTIPCALPCVHGSCWLGSCVCNSGWYGLECNSSSCVCIHGSCATGSCVCTTGWTGPICNTTSTTCPNNCSGHGTCNTSTGVCTCDSGWSGNDCSQQQGIGSRSVLSYSLLFLFSLILLF
jgi:Leucine-rich repeat (LRR) protein